MLWARGRRALRAGRVLSHIWTLSSQEVQSVGRGLAQAHDLVCYKWTRPWAGHCDEHCQCEAANMKSSEWSKKKKKKSVRLPLNVQYWKRAETQTKGQENKRRDAESPACLCGSGRKSHLAVTPWWFHWVLNLLLRVNHPSIHPFPVFWFDSGSPGGSR